MLLHDHQSHFAHPGGDRVRLLDLIEAVAVVFQHLLQAADLPFDFAQPSKHGLPFLTGPLQIKPAVDETIFHAGVYTPYQYPWCGII